jgi:hypothetical protein
MTYLLRNIAAVVLALSVAAGSQALTFGAQYVQTDACGNGTISNTKPDASGFVTWMQFYGHQRKFFFANKDAWPGDVISSHISGGEDSSYADDVNIYYVATHGSSNATSGFLYTAGSTKTVDGLSTCRARTRHPSTGAMWWRMGDKNNRILSLGTCQGLNLTDLHTWDPVQRGLHIITGFDRNVSDNPNIGGNYGFYGNMPFTTVKQAWFLATPPKGSGSTPNRGVIMAYGTSLNDAVNRRDNQRFSWSTARLGTATHRAWAWIN